MSLIKVVNKKQNKKITIYKYNGKRKMGLEHNVRRHVIKTNQISYHSRNFIFFQYKCSGNVQNSKHGFQPRRLRLCRMKY